MPPKIVLVHPQIPQNTGNIARLTAANCTSLHLIEPYSFELSDKQVKRAGLDYWPETDVHSYSNWEDFLLKTNVEETSPEQTSMWFFTTKASKVYLEAKFAENDYLVFGNETEGLGEEYHQRYSSQRLRIPIANDKVRSLNLANAASIALYEAQRQLGTAKHA